MKRILVTGAAGQLGLTLQELAPDYPTLIFEFKSHHNLDITSENEVDRIFADLGYDYCINCAAYTNVEEAERNPQEAFAVNANGVKNLAKACLKKNVVLVHISTDYVFDGTKKSPYLPNDKPNPINEYGKSKLLGEQYIQEILKQYYIVRTSWLYSKKYGSNFYKTILEKAKHGLQIKVTDLQMGCPTEANSLVQFVIDKLVFNSPTYGIYHHTDDKVMTWFDFAKKILFDNGLENETELVMDRNYRTFAQRPKNSTLSHNQKSD